MFIVNIVFLYMGSIVLSISAYSFGKSMVMPLLFGRISVILTFNNTGYYFSIFELLHVYSCLGVQTDCMQLPQTKILTSILRKL